MMNSRTTVTAVLLSCLAFHQQQQHMVVIVDGFVAKQPLHRRSSLYSENPNPNFPPPPGAVGTETLPVKPSMESRSTQASMNPERSTMRINNNPTNNIRDPAFRDDKFRLENRFNTNTSPNEVELEERLARLERLDLELKQRLNTLQRAPTQRVPNNFNNRRGGNNMNSNFRDTPMESRRRPAYRDSEFARNMQSINEIWDNAMPVTVQGGSLRTWSYANPAVRRVYVLLRTDGRPLNADVELWQGPDNTPQKMKVYVEDGGKRTFSAFIDTPRSPNTISVKNSGNLAFPMYACIGPDTGAGEACMIATDDIRPEVIQGGALRTYPFDPNVDSVAVVIKTDGRPLNARIELLQGPNNNKQIIELYTEDGLDRPFMAIIQTPGSGNVVRVVNSAPIEFPMYATVAPFELVSEDAYYSDGIQIGQEW